MEVGWSIVVALLGVLSIIYLLVRRQFSYWVDKGVLGPKPVVIFGNFKDVWLQRKSAGQFFRDMYMDHPGQPFVGFYITHTPALLIRDPELIRHVLVKDTAYFIDHYAQPNMERDPLAARGLFNLHGERWKHVRSKISPAFTSGRLKKMFHLVLECGTELKKYLADVTSHSQPVEVKEITAKSMTDVITSCAFGINSNCLSDPNAEFREFGRVIFANTPYSSFSITTSFFVPWLTKLLGFSFIPAKTTQFLRQAIGGIMEAREQSKAQRNDLIDLLLQLKNTGRIDEQEEEEKTNTAKRESASTASTDFCEDDLVAQATTFYLAGFETSSSTITFALYELALAPELQDKVRREVNEVIDRHQGQLTYEGVQEMKYLDMVVSETLRKYSAMPFLERLCVKDYTIPGTNLTIEKGTPIYVPLHGLHYDPDFFPEPERFDPERFSEERRSSIVPYTYMPFGEGPRICIGSRFALMTVKTTLANILMNLQVQTNNATPIPLQFDRRALLTSTEGGLTLNITNIE